MGNGFIDRFIERFIRIPSSTGRTNSQLQPEKDTLNHD